MPRSSKTYGGSPLTRYGKPIFPHLDPKFNPSHPTNSPPTVEDDPFFPLGPQQRARLERQALDEAISGWTPPHVPRAWETDPHQAKERQALLSLRLSPKIEAFSDLIPSKEHDSSLVRAFNRSLRPDEDRTDFRAFAALRLHLAYHRFHASTEPYEPEDSRDPLDTPPDDICFLMEYTEGECNITRRKIAWGMGLFPAVCDERNPDYDEDMAFRYDRRLYCRCHRRNKRCVRPSHIEIFTSSFETLP